LAGAGAADVGSCADKCAAEIMNRKTANAAQNPLVPSRCNRRRCVSDSLCGITMTSRSSVLPLLSLGHINSFLVIAPESHLSNLLIAGRFFLAKRIRLAGRKELLPVDPPE